MQSHADIYEPFCIHNIHCTSLVLTASCRMRERRRGEEKEEEEEEEEEKGEE